MRECLVFGAAIAALLSACGGSSSETPPPLQPDPKGFHYASPALSPGGDGDAGAILSGNGKDDEAKPGTVSRPSTRAPAAPR